MATDACVGVQDMGAAGLTCATSRDGIARRRRRRDRRRAGAAARDRHDAVRDHAVRVAGAHAADRQARPRGGSRAHLREVGSARRARSARSPTDELLRIKHHGVVVAEVPNRALTDEAPVYRRPFARPAGRDELQQIPRGRAAAARRGRPTRFSRCSASPTVASKRWIYQQYDHMVRTNTIALAGASAGVVRVKGTHARAGDVGRRQRPLLRSSIRGRARGWRVAEAARNVACAGGLPIGATNCLNFGNPERPEIMWQFAEAVAGHRRGVPRARHADHRRQRQPLQRDRRPRDSADAGHRRRRRDRGRVARADARVSGRRARHRPARRESRRARRQRVSQDDARPDARPCRRRSIWRASARCSVCSSIWRRAGCVRSAHDCAEGGLAVALAECCFETGGIGADVAIARVGVRMAASIGWRRRSSASRRRACSSASRPIGPTPCCDAARAAGVPAARIGRTGGRRFGSPSTARSRSTVRWRKRKRAGARASRTGSTDGRHERHDTMDKFKEECGVFGIYGHSEAANLTYLGLYALQHRGQESVGIATSDGGRLQMHKAMGYVADNFDEATIDAPGRHERRRPRPVFDGRRERAQERAADPHRLRARRDRDLPQRQSRERAGAARRRSSREGSIFQTTSDTEVLLHLYARSKARDARAGADRGGLAGAGRVLARAADEGSADCRARSARVPAADARPARRRLHRLLRDVRARSDRRRVDSRHRAGRSVHRRSGRREVDASVSAGAATRTASSSTCISRGRIRTSSARASTKCGPSSAAGSRASSRRRPTSSCRFPTRACARRPDIAEASGVPLQMGLIRNHYVGRTFIEPHQSIRHFGVRVKLNPVQEHPAGPARRARRRLDRARHDEPEDREDGARRRARAKCTCASAVRRRSRRASTASTRRSDRS